MLHLQKTKSRPSPCEEKAVVELTTPAGRFRISEPGTRFPNAKPKVNDMVCSTVENDDKDSEYKSKDVLLRIRSLKRESPSLITGTASPISFEEWDRDWETIPTFNADEIKEPENQ